MKCCRCGKPFYNCKAMHPIDPPGTENRRWVCLDCETAEENATLDPKVREIERIILNDNERCGGYVGVACVDGTCPKANREEYEERGIPLVRNCGDCHFYKGCEDCALYETEYCDKNKISEVFGNGKNEDV